MEKELCVLIVEDVPSDAELVQRLIKTVLKNPKFLIVDTEDSFIDAIKSFKPDIIISDYMLPNFDGLSALFIKQKMCPMVPFIMLTGSANEDIVVDCMKQGADNYVIKEHITHLGSAILGAFKKKKDELAHKKSEMYFDNILINMTEGVAIHTLLFKGKNPVDYIILKVNKSYEKIIGKTKKQVEGKLASDVYGDVPLIDVFSDVVINNAPKKFDYYYPDMDKHFNISVAPWNDVGFITIFTDITEKKRADEIFSKAQEIAKIGTWKYDFIENKLTWTDQTYELFDVEKGTTVDYDKFLSLIHKDDRVYVDTTWIGAVNNKTQYDIEHRIIVNDEIKWLREKADIQYNSENIPIKAIGFSQDITKKKLNEEALEKSNSIKSIFLSNISHELKTPLNAIIGFSEILLQTDKSKKSERFLKSINSNAKHLDELLNNILDLSKIESNEFDILYDNFLISDLFDELFDIFEEINYKKNLDFVKLKFENKKDITIISDYLRLKQILFNLISNSIKFTDNGYIKVSFNMTNNFITFTIEDTGIGIQPDKIKNVFDRFWQCDSGSRKKYKGAGLGLSISKSITELLGGEIWVESFFNRGTTFHVKIPLKEDIEYPQDIKKDFSNKNILIIDDIPAIYSLLGIYLNSLNINIISARVDNILEIYKKQKDKIDLIIIDLNIFEKNIENCEILLKNIKNIKKECTIISKSGVKQDIGLIDYHLINPISKVELLLILNEVWQN